MSEETKVTPSNDGADVPNTTGAEATPTEASNAPEQETQTIEPTSEKLDLSDFPENWREKIGGDDEKLTKLLGRYGSPKEVAKALREANSKLSQRNEIKIPDANSSDEEISKWRKAVGVPEKPEDYKLDFEVDEASKPMIDNFLQKMHGVNTPPEFINTALNAYNEMKEQEFIEVEKINQQNKDNFEDVLRTEYGADYKGNLNAADKFINEHFGEDTAHILKNAVGIDGVMLFHNPDFMRGIVNLALEKNPVATMPSGLSNTNDARKEFAEIKNLMAIASPQYYNNPEMQRRYAELKSYLKE